MQSEKSEGNIDVMSDYLMFATMIVIRRAPPNLLRLHCDCQLRNDRCNKERTDMKL